MNEALHAHLRLLEHMRDRISTHYAPSSTQPTGRRYGTGAIATLRERLLRLQMAGVPRQQMAKECGTSSKTIVRLLGNARIMYRPIKGNWRQMASHRREWIRRHGKGLTREQIAMRLGISVVAVSQHLNALGMGRTWKQRTRDSGGRFV